MTIDFAHQTRLYLGLYERELSRYFRALARPGMRCFDVGANAGYNALMLGRLTGAPVVTFECDRACLPGLAANVAANPYDVTVVEAMVGAEDGDGMTTLDSAAKTYGTPGFVKMDIEGAEGDALRGATHLLRDGKPSWIIEVHGVAVEDECLSLLRDAGYDPRIVDPSPFFPEERPLAHNRWIVAPSPRG